MAAKNKYPTFHIEGCQIKSKGKLKILCQSLTVLEEEIGIKECNISFKDLFVCPWIDLTEFTNSTDQMEKLVGGLLVKLDIIKYGKKSKYKNIKRK